MFERRFHIPWRRTLIHLPATSTHSLRRNHTCNRSPRRHSFRFYMHQTHRNLVDTTFVRAATVAINVCSHTHRSMMGNTPTASRIPEPISIAAFAVPSKENSSKQWNSKAPIVAQHSISLHVRVVGDQNANRDLIRVRHHSRTSP